jgi:hypothetical protein
MSEHWPPRYLEVEPLTVLRLYYLEPGAWVKRYLTEAGSAWVHRFFDD